MTLLPLFVALALTAEPVSIQYKGPLDEAVRKVAREGGLNVMVTTPLPDVVQIDFDELPADQALQSMARAYGMELRQEGNLWVLRRGAGPSAEATAGPPLAPATPLAPVPPMPPAEAEAEAPPSARAAAPVMARRDGQRVGFGNEVRVESGTRVDTAVAYGASVVVEPGGTVDGDAVAFGGDVVLEDGAVVGGDAVAFGGTVSKADGATVRGDAVNFGSTGLGVRVGQRAAKLAGPERLASSVTSTVSSPGGHHRLARLLLQFAVLFGLGFLLMVFAPTRMKALEETVRAEPGKSALVGILGLAVATIATVLLTLTIVGIPVVMVLWPAIAFFVAAGLVAVASRLGMALPVGRLRRTQALALALGTLALVLVSMVPVLGPMLVGVAAMTGLGAVVRTRFGQPGRGTPVIDLPRQSTTSCRRSGRSPR